MDNYKEDGIFIRKVLAYYRKNGRSNLPWRKNINPYRILVSEIMLQQTQVQRVVPKFTMWMKKYPTLASLKKASLQEILILWQGLGYQRRAKALFDIAQNVKAFPKSFEGLCKLQGVGAYTASAIGAFAYNTFSHPLIETNIRTALIEEYYKSKKKISDTTLLNTLLRLEKNIRVIRVGARTFYYALMDYGAHLKKLNISHNIKSSQYTKQSSYKGSLRELRTKVLFAIAHNKVIPREKRTNEVLSLLIKEGYIEKFRSTYRIKHSK